MFITPALPMMSKEAKAIIDAVDFTHGARVIGEKDGKPFTVKLRSTDGKYDVTVRHHGEEVDIVLDTYMAIHEFLFNEHIFKFLTLPETISANPYYWAANLETSTNGGQVVHVNFTGLHRRIDEIIARLKTRSEATNNESFGKKILFLEGLLPIESVEELLTTVASSEYPDIFELFRGQSLFTANMQFALNCAIARKAMLHAANLAGWE